MNKLELIANIASSTNVAKTEVIQILEAFENVIKSELTKGGKVTLVGFGTFKISERKARVGRNPQTGAAINIAATKMPVFKAGKELKEDVNK